MAFTSPSFLLFVLAYVLVLSAVRGARARAWAMLVANGIFLSSCAARPSELVPLLAFMALGYGLIEALRRTHSEKLLWLGLLVVLGSFVTLKKYAFVPPSLTLPAVYQVVGLSYVLFRVVHLAVDAKQGELVGPISPLAFFNYAAGFLTLTAGPIQRYEDFERDANAAPSLDAAVVYAAFARIIRGFLLIAVVSAVLDYLFKAVSPRVMGDASAFGPLLAAYLTSALLYTGFLYANFSGYMDVVIGVGRLVGLRLPENFDRPFRARSFLDFWARWHITLSQWFRTYVFNPLLKLLATRVTSPRWAPYLAVLAFFVTFLLMGVWHGASSVYVVYGLFMGAGASINKLWQVLAQKRLGKARYKALGEQPTVAYLARGLTFAYFALGLSCLWLSLGELGHVMARLGPHGLLLGYLGLSTSAGLGFALTDTAVGFRARLGSRWPAPGAVAGNLRLAAGILLILSVSSFFHKAPEFVYRAF